MIDSLAEHGVTPDDLAPALMTTHTIVNPEYDEAEARRQEETHELPDIPDDGEESSGDVSGDAALDTKVIEARFEKASTSNNGQKTEPSHPPPPYREDSDEADIADLVGSATLDDAGSGTATPRQGKASSEATRDHHAVPQEEEKAENPLAMGKALPGVSTTLSKTDKNVTLDIRWTVVSWRLRGTNRCANILR
jgi:hypothetical protein